MKRFAVVCAVMVAACACGAPASESAPKDLRLFYQKNCAQCHGVDGSARDSKGRSLRGQDFTDARWRTRTDDAAMAKVILKGLFFGLAMPGFKDQLSQEEAGMLVTGILRTAAKGKAIEPLPAVRAGQ